METVAEGRETDMLVVGSGAAGLVAALAARTEGRSVTVVEKAGTIGGTTATSAGVVWVPNNRHMRDLGMTDSREDAITYMTRLSDGRSEEAAIAAFVDAAPAVIDFLEEATGLRFKVLEQYPDYFAEFPGGKPCGRSLDSGLFDTNELGPWKDRLRASPIFQFVPMSVTEFFAWKAGVEPMNVPIDTVMKRVGDGFVGYGAALVGQLFRACLACGVEFLIPRQAQGFLVENGRVVGLRTTHDGKQSELRARRGVVLASGGFEWDRALCARFLGGVLTHPASPPSNQGDGLRMLMTLGVGLANTTEAWWCPTVSIPGEEYDGAPLFRGEFTIRALPHSIIVNRKGARFVNEAHNYNDLMKAFFRFDPATYERPNFPAWLVFDSTHVEKYPVLTSLPGSPPPQWVPRGATIAELASTIGADPSGLSATVKRFNGFAVAGVDADFARGEALYDRVYGDARESNPCLGALQKPPFYALQLHAGALGTKGGARVDTHARVLRPDGAPIPGLYAAGNVAAACAGAGYPGAGATIAAAMTFGYLAGRHAASIGDAPH
ncbi:FAD-dependent oxidoreductase [Bradyrhizobium diazoefficiens]|uniref:FAD-dependent oxidoreductase n=1 Tax=Bradyrhizobium diazoefficiens TaxID=1355477 RepID=UPI003594AF50